MKKSLWAGALAVCTLVAGCGAHPATKATSSAPTTAPPPPPPPPIVASALETLLPGPDQISAEMGTTGLRVTKTLTDFADYSTSVADVDCRVGSEAAEKSGYYGSGWSAVRRQILEDAGDIATDKYFVTQALVLFPSAGQAADFFTASAQRWQACSNRAFISTIGGRIFGRWDVGAVSNTNGTLSAFKAQENANGWACQRALTVANNVAIDVEWCGYDPADSAVRIAHQIGEGIATRGPGR